MSDQSGSLGDALHTGSLRSLAYCTLYILASASMIHFNKHLMHKERFPYAMPLTATHMLATFLFSMCLYFVKPSLFPSMEKTRGRRPQLLRWFTPLGIFFAISLYCSNRAYLHCTVAFLQFMKECNVAMVFAVSCMVGLQQCTRTRVLVLVWIMTGCSIAVAGEVNFIWLGFFFQVISQFSEVGKNVLGDWIMRGSELKLDPLTYTMFMAPPCLMVLIAGMAFTWHDEILVRAKEWWPLLIPNALLAFALNVSIALVIKESSAVTLILASIVKDMAIVGASMLVFGEVVLHLQLFGFAVCLTGIFTWSYMRVDPESPYIQMLCRFVGEVPAAEKLLLLPRNPQTV